MAALSFNSQLSSFLPREEFFSENETNTSNLLSDSDSPNQSPSSSAFTSPQSNSSNHNSRTSNQANVSDLVSSPCAEITEKYRGLISRRTIQGIKCIEELIAWKSQERESFIACVFGVVKSVRDSKGTKFKYVTLVDPTNEIGIELETFGMQEKIAVGQMMKACHLKVQRTGSSFAFMFTPSTKTIFYPLFSYNYDNLMGDERNKALTETIFNKPADREICHLLEKWFSLKILNGTKLSNLPTPGEFVDICCQVLAYNKSPLCMNAIIWDTTEPKYKPFFGPDERLPQGLECINYDYFQIAYERYFPLGIWKEESNDHAKHYATFGCVDLTTADDLVVLFNLQVVEDNSHPGKVSLVMRSSRKWGKAVRLCHRNSILGKLFIKKCQDYRKTFRRKLGLSEAAEAIKPNKTFKSPNKNSTASTTRTESLSHGIQHETSNSNNNNHAPRNDSSISVPETSALNNVSTAEIAQSSQQRGHLTSPKKRKANEEITFSKSQSNAVSEPTPSTSRYALRSQNRASNAEPSENISNKNDKSSIFNQPKDEDPLTRLLNKAKGVLDWDVLLSNGVNGLNLLHESVEEELILNQSFPLTRTEYLQLIKLAIGHLTTAQLASSSSLLTTKS